DIGAVLVPARGQRSYRCRGCRANGLSSGGVHADRRAPSPGGSDMMRRWKTVVMGLALAAATGVGPDSVQAKPAGETGGRHLGSRISSGSVSNHTCVVKEDGTVQCWGSNVSGQLG